MSFGLNTVVDTLAGVQGSPGRPDYQQAAYDTGQASREAALWNTIVNRANQYNPFASQTWTANPGGSWTQNVNFSPEMQQQFNFANMLKSGLGDQVMQAASSPMDFSGLTPIPSAGGVQNYMDTVSKALFDRGMRSLQPQFDRALDRQNADLVSRGFSVGGEAYDKAVGDLRRSQGDIMANLADSSNAAATTAGTAFNNIGLADRNQEISEILAQRARPFEEYGTALGFTPQIPSFNNYYTGANSQGGDYLGATQAQGAFDLGKYQADTQRTLGYWESARRDASKATSFGMMGGMGGGG